MSTIEEMAAEMAAEAKPADQATDSPVWSPAGNIRSVSQMGPAKFEALLSEMADYREADPKGWAKVAAEADKRGLAY